jgi:hypothetical protein
MTAGFIVQEKHVGPMSDIDIQVLEIPVSMGKQGYYIMVSPANLDLEV